MNNPAPFRTSSSRPSDKTEKYVDAASRIGAQLVRTAIWHRGICNWFGPVLENNAGSHHLACGTLGPGLYDGTAGIALFLGYLHHAKTDPVFAGTAKGAIEHALGQAEDVPEEIRFGFYTGFVGIGYAATEVGRCLDDPGLVERGLELIRSSLGLNPDGKVVIDVMSGNAGVVPVLLRLHAQTGEAWLLDAARSRGEVLLARASRSDRGLSWDVIGELAGAMDLSKVSEKYANVSAHDHDRPHLIGLSHGAGGVAWALLELGTAVGDTRMVDAAKHGFAYEDSWLDTSHDRWPDLRQYEHDKENSMSGPIAWCHGAVGIGLARMRAWKLTGDDRYREDALVALRMTTRSVLGGIKGASNYSLCHGLAGDAELFLQWQQLTGDVEARQIVDLIAERGIQEYGNPRRPWPSGLDGGAESPSLMLGIAGTGCFYLRAAQAGHTPSVLLVGPDPG